MSVLIGHVSYGVKDPVHLRAPAAVVSVVHLLHEVVQGLLLRLVQGQGLPDVSDVVERLQLRHSRAQHHGEEVDEEVGVLPDCQVRFVAHLLESEEGSKTSRVKFCYPPQLPTRDCCYFKSGTVCSQRQQKNHRLSYI